MMLGFGIRRLPTVLSPAVSSPVHTSKRFLVSRKQRRKFERTGELNVRGAGTQKAVEKRQADEKQVSLGEAMQQVKLNPYLFLGVIPLLSWFILIAVRPELREQMDEKWRETRLALFPVQEGNDRKDPPQ
jgi:hypothetical protein